MLQQQTVRRAGGCAGDGGLHTCTQGYTLDAGLSGQCCGEVEAAPKVTLRHPLAVSIHKQPVVSFSKIKFPQQSSKKNVSLYLQKKELHQIIHRIH